MGYKELIMPKGGSMTDFLIDFAAGGISGAVSKTLTAPIERVKLVIQTQAFNLAFKDTIKAMFPKFNNKTDFWKFFAVQLASGGFAGAASLSIVYPLDYARTRLASDVGAGKKQFEGLVDCLKKTAGSAQGPLALYNGFGPSVAGIIAYRGAQFGLNDTIMSFNPYAKDFGFVAVCSKFVVAQIAVTASGLVAYPFDTVRRRLQMESDRPIADRMYKGTIDCGAKILKTEGMGGVYKGALANIFRGVGASLVLVLYGEIQLALEKSGR